MHKGTITEWNDARGFGWVEAEGERLFVHINEFDRGQRRPRVGEKVRFVAGADPQGRRCAKSIVYIKPGGRVSIGAWLQLLVLLVLPGLALSRLPIAWWIGPSVIALVSWMTYMMYSRDKKQATSAGSRIPESTLHTAELLGGWPGAFLAQRRLRHKCSKVSYQFTFWCIVGLFQLVATDFIFDHQLSEWARPHITRIMTR